MTPNQNDTFHQGKSRRLDFECAPKTHTGSTFTWTLKSGGSEGTTVLTKTESTGVYAVGTEVRVQIDPADTAALRGAYFHELTETDVDGLTATLAEGWVTILPSAT